MSIFSARFDEYSKVAETKTNTRKMAEVEKEHQKNKSNNKSDEEKKCSLLQIVFMQCQTKHLQNDSESISKLQSHKVVNRSKSSHFFLSLLFIVLLMPTQKDNERKSYSTNQRQRETQREKDWERQQQSLKLFIENFIYNLFL